MSVCQGGGRTESRVSLRVKKGEITDVGGVRSSSLGITEISSMIH